MNKKNKRVREQVIDLMLRYFGCYHNWVRELDIPSQYVDYDRVLLSYESKKEIRNLLREKLKRNEIIKLRTPLSCYHNNRKYKNLPSIILDISINRADVIIKWELSNKFGKHYDSSSITDMQALLNTVQQFISQLHLLLNINYQEGVFKKYE